jgi:chromosome condensin MukBEF complex kleisin-like MukF subunit
MSSVEFLPLSDLNVFTHELQQLADKAVVNAQVFQALSDRLDTLEPKQRELMALIVVKQQRVLEDVEEQLHRWRQLVLDEQQRATINKCQRLLTQTRETNRPLTQWFPMESTAYH